MFYSTRIVPPDLKSLRARLRVEFRRRGAVYLVLFLTSIPAAIVFLRAKYNVETREAARFEAATRYVQEALVARVNACIQTLYGIQGLFDASQSVEPEEW
ncbi:MAG: hypothetical protein HYZ36_04840, partial [Pedosphaera parvula]|nr:hypothetical protein [Pedosphaera parvula]